MVQNNIALNGGEIWEIYKGVIESMAGMGKTMPLVRRRTVVMPIVQIVVVEKRAPHKIVFVNVSVT